MDELKIKKMHISYWVKYWIALSIVIVMGCIYVPFISKNLTYAMLVEQFFLWVMDFVAAAFIVTLMRVEHTDVVYPDGEIPALRYLGIILYLGLLVLGLWRGNIWMDTIILTQGDRFGLAMDATAICVWYINMWVVGAWGFDFIKDPKEFYLNT